MTWRNAFPSFVLLGFSLLLGTALGELGLRIVAGRAEKGFGKRLATFDPAAILIQPHGQFGYRQKPLGVFTYPVSARAHTNAMGFRGPLVAIPKPPGTVRVVLLGGSTTHGWGVNDDRTIDAYMRQILAERLPSLHVEVVNLGFDGYDAYQDFERLRTDGLRLEPDLVIANSGINDVRNAKYPNLQDHDPRTLIWEVEMRRLREELRRGGPTWWNRLKHYSYLARLPGFVRIAQKQTSTARAPQKWRPYPDAVDNFELNLRRIAQLLERPPVPLILATPASALRARYLPKDESFRDYWVVDAATTQEYRDRLADRMRSVAASLQEQGRPVEYLHPDLSPEMFLDDAHPKAEGNRQIAQQFADAAVALLRPSPSSKPQGVTR